jgi:hypothetical protein
MIEVECFVYGDRAYLNVDLSCITLGACNRESISLMSMYSS